MTSEVSPGPEDSDDQFLASLRQYSKRKSTKSSEHSSNSTREQGRKKNRKATGLSLRPAWWSPLDGLTLDAPDPSNDVVHARGEEIAVGENAAPRHAAARCEELDVPRSIRPSRAPSEEKLAELIAQTKRLREAGDGQEQTEDVGRKDGCRSMTDRLEQLKKEVEVMRSRRLRRLDEEQKRAEFKCNHTSKSYDPKEVQRFMEERKAGQRYREELEKEKRAEELRKKSQMLKELERKTALLRRASILPDKVAAPGEEVVPQGKSTAMPKRRSSSVPSQGQMPKTNSGRAVVAEKPFETELLRSDQRIKTLAVALNERLESEGPSYLQKLRVFYKLRNTAKVPEPPTVPRRSVSAHSVHVTKEKDTSDDAKSEVSLRPAGNGEVVFYTGDEPDLSAGELSDDSDRTGADISLVVYRESGEVAPPSVQNAPPGSASATSKDNVSQNRRERSRPPSSTAIPSHASSEVDALSRVSGAELRRILLQSLSKNHDHEKFGGSSEFGLIEALKCKLRMSPEELNLTGQLRIPLNRQSRPTADAAVQPPPPVFYNEKGVQATEMVDKAVDVSSSLGSREDKALQTTLMRPRVDREVSAGSFDDDAPERVPEEPHTAPREANRGSNGTSRRLPRASPSVFTRVRLPPPAGMPGGSSIPARFDLSTTMASNDTSIASTVDTTVDESHVVGQQTGALGYAPRTLDMRFRTELAYLESLEESLRQLADLYRVHSVTGAKQDNMALAEIVQMKQQELLPLMQAEQQRRDTVENRKREIENEARQLKESIARAAHDMESVQKETRALLAESADKMTETQAQIAQATSEALKAIGQFGFNQLQQQDVPRKGASPGRRETDAAQSVAVAAAIKTAMRHLKESHKLIHAGHSSVSSLSEDPTVASIGDSNDSSSESKVAEEPVATSREGNEKRKDITRKASAASIGDDVGTEVEISKAESVPEDDGDQSSADVVTEENTAYSDDFEAPSNGDVSSADDTGMAVLGGNTFGAGSNASVPRRPVVQLGRGAIKPPSGQFFTVGQALVTTDFAACESFVNMNLVMVDQQLADLDSRYKQQKSILKMKETAIAQSARAEVADLEIEKRNAEATGDKQALAAIRKRQTHLKDRLKAEKARMVRLKEEVAAEIRKERDSLLKQREGILKFRSQTLVSDKATPFEKPPLTSWEKVDGSSDSDKENRNSTENTGSRSKEVRKPSYESPVPEELAVNEAREAGSIETVAEEIVTELPSSNEQKSAGDDTSAAAPSSKFEVAAEPATVVRHSRSHSDDSKARRGLLVPDLCRSDLDRSYSASQLPVLEEQLQRTRSGVHVRAASARRSNQGETSSGSSPSDVDDPFGRKAWRSLKRIEVNKRYLTRKEQQLVERRKNVEELLAWRARLEKEEQLVRKLEEEALNFSSAAASPTVTASEKVSDVEPIKRTSAEGSSATGKSELPGSSRSRQVGSGEDEDVEECVENAESGTQVSESTIREEVEEEDSSAQEIFTERDDTVKESSQIVTEMSKTAEHHDYSIDSFESGSETAGPDHGLDVAAEGVSESRSGLPHEVSEEESRQKRLREKFRRRAGLSSSAQFSPRSAKPLRRASSDSEDSFTHSQTETSDAGSDVEGRIYALQEELKRRHREVERLKREAKRRYREKLKVKEQALKQQIESYDAFICQTKQELEHELSDVDLHAGAVKPQIKQPKFKQKERVKDAPGSNVTIKSSESKSAPPSLPAAPSVEVRALEKSEPVEDEARSRASSVSSAQADEGDAVPDTNLPSAVDYSSYSSVFEEQVSHATTNGEESPLDDVAAEEAGRRAWSKTREASEPVAPSEEEKTASVAEEIEEEEDVSHHTESEADFPRLELTQERSEQNREVEELEISDHQSPVLEAEEVSRRSSASTDTILESPVKNKEYFEEEEGIEPSVAEEEVSREKAVFVEKEEHEEVAEIGDEAEPSVAADTSAADEETADDNLLNQSEDEEKPEESIVSNEDKLEPESVKSDIEEEIEEEVAEESLVEQSLVDGTTNLMEFSSTLVESKGDEESFVQPPAVPLTPESQVEATSVVEKKVQKAERIVDDILAQILASFVGELRESSGKKSEVEGVPEKAELEQSTVLSVEDTTVREDSVVEELVEQDTPKAEEMEAEEYPEKVTSDSLESTDSSHERFVDALTEDLAKDLLDDVARELVEIQNARAEKDIVKPPLPRSPTDFAGRAVSPVDRGNLASAVACNLSPVDFEETADLLAPLSPGTPMAGGCMARKPGDGSASDDFDPAHGTKTSDGWIDDDLVLLEHEKLKEKQAQIEHEIQELEALQQLQQLQQAAPFILREIPNKPPPPYTPPKSTSPSGSPRSRGHRHSHGGHRLSKADLQRLAHEACRVIPVFKEEHGTYLAKAAEIIFKAHAKGADLESLSAPESFFGLKETGDDPDSVVRRCYVEMLFDLAKETATELFVAADDHQRPSYMKPKLVSHRRWLVPRSSEELKAVACKAGLRCLGFEPHSMRDRLVVEWTKKKKDSVDRILVMELQNEESVWTDFEEEEVFIKNKLTNNIFDCLIVELARELKAIKEKRSTSDSPCSPSPDFS